MEDENEKEGSGKKCIGSLYTHNTQVRLATVHTHTQPHSLHSDTSSLTHRHTQQQTTPTDTTRHYTHLTLSSSPQVILASVKVLTNNCWLVRSTVTD